MKVREITIKIYGCEVCGEEYGYDEETARKCEKLPVEKQVIKKGEKVNDGGHDGVISNVRLMSPFTAGQTYDQFPRGKHFYVYTIEWSDGCDSTHFGSELRPVKKVKVKKEVLN